MLHFQTKRLFDAEFRLEGIGDKVSTEKPLETRDDHLQFCMHKVVEYCKSVSYNYPNYVNCSISSNYSN